MFLFETFFSRHIFGDPGRLRPRLRVLHGAGLRAVAALSLQVQDQPGEERAPGEEEGDQGKATKHEVKSPSILGYKIHATEPPTLEIPCHIKHPLY